MHASLRKVLVISDDAMWRTRAVNGLGPLVRVYLPDSPGLEGAMKKFREVSGLDVVLLYPVLWLAMEVYYQLVVELRETGFTGIIMTASDSPVVNHAMMAAGCDVSSGRDNAPQVLLRKLEVP